jgi:hypothetical protein
LAILQQGDILATVRGVGKTLLAQVGADLCFTETPSGVSVVSQTCDIARDYLTRPDIQVSPLVRLDGQRLAQARDGLVPRYVPLPGADDSLVVDLDFIITVPKSCLVHFDRLEGCHTDAERRAFGRAVGRKFSRFPFPDEVSEQIAKLVDAIRDKHDRPASAIGRILKRIMEIRLQADTSWSDPDTDIQLVIICEPGQIPTIDELPVPRPDLQTRLRLNADGRSSLAPALIADLLEAAYEGDDAAAVLILWQHLVDSWAEQCNGVSPKRGTQRPHRFVGEFLEADEFPLTRVRSSEILDVDSLSAPWPA